MLLVFLHEAETHERPARGLQGIVLPVAQTFVEEGLLDDESIGGVGRIDDDDAAPEVGDRLDSGLREKLLQAAVAAHDDDRLGTGLGQRDRIVDGRMRDLERALGKTLALRRRVGRELQVHVETGACKKPFGLAGEDGHVLHARENIHAQLLRLIRTDCNRREKADTYGSREQSLCHHGSLPPIDCRTYASAILARHGIPQHRRLADWGRASVVIRGHVGLPPPARWRRRGSLTRVPDQRQHKTAGMTAIL